MNNEYAKPEFEVVLFSKEDVFVTDDTSYEEEDNEGELGIDR